MCAREKKNVYSGSKKQREEWVVCEKRVIDLPCLEKAARIFSFRFLVCRKWSAIKKKRRKS